MVARVPLASRRVRYGVVAVVAGVILVASVVEPGPGAPSQGPFGLVGADKWSHGLAYAGLAATLAYALVDSSRRGYLVTAVCLAVGFGVVVELVQWPIPYRTGSAVDALADAAGAGLLALAWWLLDGVVRFVPRGERSGSR